MDKEFTKVEVTLLVIRFIEYFLGILRACAYIVTAISGFGNYKKFMKHKTSEKKNEKDF